MIKRRGEDLVWRDLEGEVVLLDLRASMYYSLNQTGSLLWSCLEQPSSPEELVRAVVEEYGVSVEQAREDVDGFLDMLSRHELIEPV